MPHEKFKPPYSVFAEFYDQIAAPLRAPNLRAREEILLPLLRPESRTPNPEPRVFCDLCCGTGTTALEFARRGLRVYGVDGSRDMLKVARAKFAKAGLRVETIHADMRTFRLPETVNLITCEFDAINHVKHKRDLEAVARAVARALRPGGKFFF
jgi:ubiquinone/menaquinone biosynthesis C-methylase UbiE